MKKTMRSLITVILVFVMLFAVLAPTVGAAPAGSNTGSNSGSTGGSVVTEWIELTYDSDKISVVLKPGGSELSSLSTSQLKQVLNALISALGDIVLDDIKAQFISDEYGSGVTAISPADAFTYALDKHVLENYEGDDDEAKYLAFLRAALADGTNGVVAELSDFVCRLVTDAVKTDLFKVDELLTKTEAVAKLETVLENEIDNRVDAHIAYYVEEYVAWIDSDGSVAPDIDANVFAYAKELTTAFILAEAAKANGAEYDANDPVHVVLKEYIDRNGAITEANALDAFHDSLVELKTGDPARHDELLLAIRAEVDAEAATVGFKDEVYLEYLGVDAAALAAKRAEYITLISEDYAAAVEGVKSNSSMELEDVLAYLQGIKVDTYQIFEPTASNGAMFNKTALIDFINSIPTFDEIAATADDDMAWSWSVVIDTTMGISDFVLEIAVGSPTDSAEDKARYCSNVRKIADVIADHFSYSIDHDDTVALNIKVPAVFSKFLSQGFNTADIPDSLKRQFFAAFSTYMGDIANNLNDLTFNQIIDALEEINFEGIVTSESIKQYIDLTGYTNEQIVNKIKSFEKYITLAKKLAVDVLGAVPGELQGDSVMDYYYKNGIFQYDGTHYLDIETILTAITERYGKIFAPFFGDEFDYITLDLDVTFQGMNRVRYTSDGTVVEQGILPAGADVSFFGPTSAPNGVYGDNEVAYWVDASTGAQVTHMPERDIVLKPVFKLPTASWNYTAPMTYNGEVQYPELVAVPQGYTVEYVFTNLEGETVESKNAGEYIVTAIFKNADGVVTELDLPALNYTINKRIIDVSSATWSETYFNYDGTEHKVELILGDMLEGFPENAVAYEGNVETKLGQYTATAVSGLQGDDANNYELILPAQSNISWQIDFGTIDMSGVEVKTGTTVNYDGKWHQVEVTGLPDKVVADIPAVRFPGEYEVVITFTYTGEDADYYEPIPSTTATIKIARKYAQSFGYVNTDDNSVIVSVDSLKGVLVDYKLYVADMSYAHKGYTLADGTYGKIIVAYDLNFYQDGAPQLVSDGDTLTVKILVPEIYRGYDNVKLVHIKDDGTTQIVEAMTDGNYMVFTTEHFSVYALVEITDPPVPPVEEDWTWLWILIIAVGSVLVVGLVLLVILLILKKKRKGTDPTEPTDAEPAPTEPDGDAPITQTEEEAPAEEAPVEEAPVEEAPVEEAPVEEAPVEEAPVEEAPVEEAPVEEAPVEEAPVEEAPVEEAPVEEAPVEEAPVEEAPVEEPVKTPVLIRFADEGENGERRADIDGEVVLVRFRTSFESRYIQSGVLQDYYTAIKNALMSYKGVKSRTSWNYESFNKGRIQCAKLNIKGNALFVHLALNPADYNVNKYHFTDMSDKPKFDKVPMLMKVKSERALKYTLELIAEMMKTLEIPEGNAQDVDYHMPYETTEQLASRGLVKIILPAGMILDENSNVVRVDVGAHIANELSKDEGDAPAVEEAPAEVVEEPVVEEAPIVVVPEVAVVHVDATQADEMLTNEEAEAKIEIIHTGASQRKGKLAVINLDTICDSFEEGEIVDLEALKAKRLVPKNTARVKVLARGVMTKALTVVASKYSIAAVKMIYLAGGVAELED